MKDMKAGDIIKIENAYSKQNNMNNFDYLKPESLEEALSIMADHGEDAKCMAGGQSLLLLMREGLVQPEINRDFKKSLNRDDYKLT